MTDKTIEELEEELEEVKEKKKEAENLNDKIEDIKKELEEVKDHRMIKQNCDEEVTGKIDLIASMIAHLQHRELEFQRKYFHGQNALETEIMEKKAEQQAEENDQPRIR